MPNGNDYVDWDYMRQHEAKMLEDKKEVQKLSAEVLGDKETGRLSLRQEISKTHSMVKKFSWVIVSALGAKYVADIVIALQQAKDHIH